LAAIVVAFALWGIERLPLPEVRALIAHDRVVGFTAAAGWTTFRRWARLFVRPGQTLRQAAAQVAQKALAFASSQASVAAMAFEGAQRATF
jgi:hypothetical protein